MLAIFRIVLVLVFSISICVFGIVYCLLKKLFKQICNVSIFGCLFGSMAPIFGMRVEIRNLASANLSGSCVYIINHQNNYDMVTVSYVLKPNTITVGKRKLLWIPLFGQLYWLSGNILVPNQIRNIRQFRSVLVKIIKIIKKYNISVWIFPEGTRNRGKGLLPFKIGAFYAAIAAKVPIIPICVSNISNGKIRLNRWSNGLVIIEIMPPVETYQYELSQVKRIAAYCHKIMQLKIESLNKEVMLREKNHLNNNNG